MTRKLGRLPVDMVRVIRGARGKVIRSGPP